MNILITGGAGFIGSSLIEPLLKSGHHITIIDNLSTGKHHNIVPWLGVSNFSFIKSDVLDTSVLQKAVEGCHLVFHLAANPLIDLGNRDTSKDFQSLQATYEVLEAMRKSKTCKKILFTSTSAVYGEARVIPTPENYSPLLPISLYGASKLACEAMISGYCHIFNLSGVIFRLANIIGPNNSHGVLHDFLMKLSRDPSSLEILGNGMQNKSYLYVVDCIDAFRRVVFDTDFCSQETHNKIQVYNVGSNDRITVLDIAETIFDKMSIPKPTIHFTNDKDGRGWRGDVREYLLECSKLAGLGWKPKYNSREAVVKTISESLSHYKDASN